MKKLTICMGVLLFTFMLTITGFANPKITFKSYSDDTVQTKTINVSITGMTCGGCESKVNSHLSKTKGIVSNSVSYKDGNAVITFNPLEISEEDVIKAVNSTGFNCSKADKSACSHKGVCKGGDKCCKKAASKGCPPGCEKACCAKGKKSEKGEKMN